MEHEGQEIPETYVDLNRAVDQAGAEKKFRDEAVRLRAQAKGETDEAEQIELRLQAEFLDAQAREASNQIAYFQAISPNEEGAMMRLPSVETALAAINQQFEHPVDEATVKAYGELGVPRDVVEMGNIRPLAEMPNVRKNRLDLFRLWRVEGRLDDVLAQDEHRLEDLEERQRLGKYDETYKTDLALRDAIANTRWNISLMNEVLAEKQYPDENERGQKTRRVQELMADTMQVGLGLIMKAFDWREDPARRARVEELQNVWKEIEREYFAANYKTDWSDDFIQRVTRAKTEIEALLRQ